MTLTDENKAHIDSLSHYQLLERWRFAPTGDPWFQGDTGVYWSLRMSELSKKDPAQAIRNSKDMGDG